MMIKCISPPALLFLTQSWQIKLQAKAFKHGLSLPLCGLKGCSFQVQNFTANSRFPIGFLLLFYLLHSWRLAVELHFIWKFLFICCNEIFPKLSQTLPSAFTDYQQCAQGNRTKAMGITLKWLCISYYNTNYEYHKKTKPSYVACWLAKLDEGKLNSEACFMWVWLNVTHLSQDL